MSENIGESVRISTADNSVTLEGRLFRPPSNATNIGVVVTHPWKLLGGNLYNNVVLGVSSLLCNEFSITALAFNFRGVGESTGSGSWRGSYERDDAIAACRYLLNMENGPKNIYVIGYSYGAAIGSSVADELVDIKGYVAISYPFGVIYFLFLWHLVEKANSSKPKLYIMGDVDNFTGINNFNNKFTNLPEPKEKIIIAGADHFWFNWEKQLAREIGKWLVKQPSNTTVSTTITTD